MNGKVTDQLSQLIHCPLDIQIKRGLLFCYRNKNSPKLLKRSEIPYCVNANKCFSGGVFGQFIFQTLCVDMSRYRNLSYEKTIMNVYQEFSTNVFIAALFITV